MTTYRLLLPARPRGQWFGWGISLLVHAGVLAWLLYALPTLPPAADDAPRRMRFVLVPPRPQPAPPVASAPPPQPAASPIPAPAAPTVRAASATRSRTAASSSAPAAGATASPDKAAAQAVRTPVITSDAPTATEPLPVGGAELGTDADATGASPPSFDMNEARKTARLIARHRKDGLVALPKAEPPLERDDRLGRAIERARRPDCKSAYSGLGILAVIPLAKDTVTGSGCKW